MDDKIIELIEHNFKKLSEKIDNTTNMLNEKIDNTTKILNEKIDSNTKILNEVKEKVNIIEKKLDDVEVKNAKSHLDTIEAIGTLNESIDFLKYEDLKIRQDVFIMKRKMETKIKI